MTNGSAPKFSRPSTIRAPPSLTNKSRLTSQSAAANEERDRKGYSRQPQALAESQLWEAEAELPPE